MSYTQMVKRLAVFDFDHTIIQDNSDIVIMNVVKDKIPQEVKDLYKSDGWTAYMKEIFKILNNHNISEPKIKSIIENLPEVTGMDQLIKSLNKNMNYDVIIISDSNSYIINTWLEAKELKKYIYKVFTNPAQFDENGLLNIKMYHLQESCKLSTKNLCKGQIMEDFIDHQKENGVVYDKIVYAGDGLNDFCPILRLKENDLACVRHNYKCADIVLQSKSGLYKDENGESKIVKCNVYVWDNGFDILNYIKHAKI